ncbi:acyl-CoA N-acyltransferase [Coniochaeta sp. PMI_546]|nr:acyl-CoA N-acyltransferase [Coniochaeta sp. PMI_546]
MTPPKLHFRIAATEDAPRIQRLVESAFRAEDSRPQWTADMSLGRQFRMDVQQVVTAITNPDSVVLMAVDANDVLIASVEVAKRSTDLARLAMLAVDERHQRDGVGRQVLEYAEDYCRSTWAVKKTGLGALSTRKELIKWYIRRGYQRTGELTPFRPPQSDGVPVHDGLTFVELEKTHV